MFSPNLITSYLSRPFELDGHAFKLEIYRLEHDSEWIMEVIDDEGASTVWDDPFDTDEAAHLHLLDVIDKEGLSAFKGGNVVPFPYR